MRWKTALAATTALAVALAAPGCGGEPDRAVDAHEDTEIVHASG